MKIKSMVYKVTCYMTFRDIICLKERKEMVVMYKMNPS